MYVSSECLSESAHVRNAGQKFFGMHYLSLRSLFCLFFEWPLKTGFSSRLTAFINVHWGYIQTRIEFANPGVLFVGFR